jgi:hypothetical protein
MKGYRIFISILFFTVLNLSAQEFSLRIHPPPPNQLRTEDLWRVDVTNNSGAPRIVYFHAEITEARKDLMFRANSNEFESPQGRRRITARDIKEIRDEYYREEDKQFILRTGTVPAGSYDACLYLIDASNDRELAQQCIHIEVRPAGPPRLISPRSGKGLEVSRPIFTWTKPAPLPAGERVFYKFKIVEVYKGQTKEEAMRSNPAWYEEDRITRTSFQYPLKAKDLDPKRNYAWQVQSFYEEGFPLGTNRGTSEIWEVNPRIIEAIKPLLTPSYIKIGDFVVKNISYTSSSVDSLSGSGESYFLKKTAPGHFGGPMYIYVEIKFDVDFENLQVNWMSGEDTAHVLSGEIDEEFSSPVLVPVEGYHVLVHNIHMWPDSAHGSVGVSTACLYDTTGCEPVELGPFTSKLSPLPDIHKELAVADRGPYRLGETGIIIKSKEEVLIDLSRTITPSKVEITMKRGETIEQPGMDTCNTGYLYGYYTFDDGLLAPSGFSATFELAKPWKFHSLIPMGFEVNLTDGELEIEKCKVKKGKFVNGDIVLPFDSNGVVDLSGSPITAVYDSLTADSLLDLYAVVKIDKEMRWGGFGLIANYTEFRLPAKPYAYHTVIQSDTFLTMTTKITDTLIGLIVPYIDRTNDFLIVHSGDTKVPLVFREMGGTYNKIMLAGWFNLEMQGMRGYLSSNVETSDMYAQLGITSKKGYVADTTFNTTFMHDETDSTSLKFMKFWFMGNSSYNTDLRGIFSIPYPSNIKPPFREVGVTSTASFAGGNAFFPDSALTLDYWGVGLTSDRGVVSVRMGEIVYTDADVHEDVHFSTGFNIIWGEMRADGDLGEFYFNQNSAHQKFDGFPISLDSAALSPYNPAELGGELVVRSDVHFNFFGTPDELITVHDAKYMTIDSEPPPPTPDTFQVFTAPYSGRIVSIDPYYFALSRNWGSDLAEMEFDSIGYDSVDQNGFIGAGDIDFNFFKNSPVHAEIEIDSLYIKICILETQQHDVLLLHVELTGLNEIWGCAVIKGDELERIAMGARMETTTGGGFEILTPKEGVGVEVMMSITPNITTFAAEGMMYFFVLGCDLELTGSVFLKTDRSLGSVEGEIKGAFDLSALGVDVQADGQANWYFDLDSTNYIQGRLSVDICLMEFGAGLSGGLFLGYKTPKDKAWVMMEGSSAKRKFGVNMDNIPGTTISGMYVFGDLEYSIGFIGIIEGGIEIYAGVGAFTSYTGSKGTYDSSLPIPFIVGVVGVYIYGEILWGLVSASAWGELELYLGNPMGFEGTFGLRGCVLWVICGSIEVTAGINSDDGLYIE